MLHPPPRDVLRTELMDQRDTPPAELAGTLGDIARLNRLGATHSILHFLARLAAGHRARRPLRVLDVGTGGADIPLAVARWGRRRGRPVRITALDIHPEILRYAARAVRGAPEVRVVAADALAPPIRPGAVDVAICSLVLHHLPEDAVIALLRRLAEIARLGFVVSDLHRSRVAWAAVWLATRAVSRNRLTRHDGPLSVRRAYTRRELIELAGRAGLPDLAWRRAPAFRVVGVWRRWPVPESP